MDTLNADFYRFTRGCCQRTIFNSFESILIEYEQAPANLGRREILRKRQRSHGKGVERLLAQEKSKLSNAKILLNYYIPLRCIITTT